MYEYIVTVSSASTDTREQRRIKTFSSFSYRDTFEAKCAFTARQGVCVPYVLFGSDFTVGN